MERDIAVGTVPAYALTTAARDQCRGSLATRLFDAIVRQVEMGVDFLSIHPSLTADLVARLPTSGRTIPITSRGGSLIMQLMVDKHVDNPFRAIFDDLIALCSENNVALSFVGSLRSGSIADAFEELHLAELDEIRQLVERAGATGVQTIVELVNHASLRDIARYVEMGRTMFPNSALGALGRLRPTSRSDSMMSPAPSARPLRRWRASTGSTLSRRPSTRTCQPSPTRSAPLIVSDSPCT